MNSVLMIGGKNPEGNAQAPNLDASGNLSVNFADGVEVKSTVETKNAGTTTVHFRTQNAKGIEIFVESGEVRVRTDGQPASATSGEPMGEGFAKSWDAEMVSIYYKQDSVVTIIHKGERQSLHLLYNAGVESVAWIEGYSSGEGLIAKNADHLLIEAAQASGGAVRTLVTGVEVDMSKFSKLLIEWENSGDANVSNYSYLAVSTARLSSYTSNTTMLSKTSAFGRTVDVLDVSAVVDSQYIRVHARDGASTATPVLSRVKVYRIWGVK